MPKLRTHGGGCCGARHLVGFGNSEPDGWGYRVVTDREVKDQLAHLGTASGGTSSGKSVEAIITDTQFRWQPGLVQIMIDNGFRLSHRFKNSSGGMCNVLHRVTGGRDLKATAARNPVVRAFLAAEKV